MISWFKPRLPRSAIKTLLLFRRYALYSLEPLDYSARIINGKRDFPPLHLRKHVGPLRSFEASGAEFTAYLKLIADLQPHENMLDIGCGCGLLALYLRDYLDSGSYTGLDIHKPSIAWCQNHISSKYPNFRFIHSNIKSPEYNPQGAHTADELTFPLEDHTADVILLKSVFTHMRPPGVANYIKEISRLLTDGGRCLATFFLLNEEQLNLASQGRSQLSFEFGDETWRYEYKHSPERVVGYTEDYILRLLEKHGLRLKGLFYGGWSGRKNYLSHQDLLMVEKALG